MSRKKQIKEMKEVRDRWETETGTRKITASRKGLEDWEREDESKKRTAKKRKKL